MFRTLTCLTTQHDWRLVVVAGIVCFLSSLTAITLFYRARSTAGRASAMWIAAAGVATGCGIWATHFLAMLAYQPGIPIAYDVNLTVLSLVAAALVTTGGLAVAVIFPVRWGAPLGGGIIGAGVACMHYLGMAAVELPGHVEWDVPLVIASIVLGMVLGMAALSVAVRWHGSRALLASALLLTLAIVSHHFTAMGAVDIVPDPALTFTALSLSPGSLAIAVASVAVAILGMSLISAAADRRLDDKGRLLGIALDNMTQGVVMFDTNARLIVCNDQYRTMYGLSLGVVKPGAALIDPGRPPGRAGSRGPQGLAGGRGRAGVAHRRTPLGRAGRDDRSTRRRTAGDGLRRATFGLGGPGVRVEVAKASRRDSRSLKKALDIAFLDPEDPSHAIGRDLALVDESVQRPLGDAQTLRCLRRSQP